MFGPVVTAVMLPLALPVYWGVVAEVVGVPAVVHWKVQVSVLVVALIPRIERGNYEGMICTVEDITERRKIEDALQQSELKYRNLMDNAIDAIVLADEEGNIVEVNKKAEMLFGYSKAELLGMQIRQIHPKEEFEKKISSCS